MIQSGELSHHENGPSILRFFFNALKKEQFKSSLFLQTLENVADPVRSYIFESKATEWHCNGGHSKEY